MKIPTGGATTANVAWRPSPSPPHTTANSAVAGLILDEQGEPHGDENAADELRLPAMMIAPERGRDAASALTSAV
jgi:hypothetical protein